jgi:hypothetical protein
MNTAPRYLHKAASAGLVLCHLMYFAGYHFVAVIAILWMLEEAITLITE